MKSLLKPLIPLIWSFVQSSLSGSIISVNETGLGGDAAAVISPGFGEDALVYSDRSHEHNGAAFNGNTLSTSGGTVVGLPAYLLGSDYVRFANNARDNNPYSAVTARNLLLAERP